MRSKYEKLIIDDFLAIYNRNGSNAKWAIEELNYKVFIENMYCFYSQPQLVQQEIRNILKALQLIHC